MQTGLYLVQKDTTSTEGFAFRVEEDYPRLAKIESLADPLIYVCTKQEFDRIKLAKGDKKAFDRVILSITGDTERAKNFMRNYFQKGRISQRIFYLLQGRLENRSWNDLHHFRTARPSISIYGPRGMDL